MLAVTKPITYTSDLWEGPVATYDVGNLNNSQDINGYINTDNSTLGHNIGWETSPTDAEWANGSSAGYGLFTMVVSQIGSSTSPTIAELNSHPLITDYLHSSHSNSLNGISWASTLTALQWDWTNMTLTISGSDTISFTSYNAGYYTGTPPTAVRSVDTSSSTWYLNGIATGTQTGGGSDDGLAWYQAPQATNYISNISESNIFDNSTDVQNKKKTFLRASKTLADETSTALIEKYTKLINLKLLDRLIDVDDYRDAERYALSKLSASEQTTIKNLTRYS